MLTLHGLRAYACEKRLQRERTMPSACLNNAGQVPASDCMGGGVVNVIKANGSADGPSGGRKLNVNA